MLKLGLYEQLINKLISTKLNEVDGGKFHIRQSILDKEEASEYLSKYLGEVIKIALATIPNEDNVEKQIEVSNKIILLLN